MASGEAKPLTAEREADLRATVERGYPILAETAREIFSEIDRLRSEHKHLGEAALGALRAQGSDREALDTEYLIDALQREVAGLRSELASAREAALREARQKVRSYAHHALWGDLLNYQWDERTETFARQLVARIDAALREIVNPPAGAGAEAGGRDGR